MEASSDNRGSSGSRLDAIAAALPLESSSDDALEAQHRCEVKRRAVVALQEVQSSVHRLRTTLKHGALLNISTMDEEAKRLRMFGDEVRHCVHSVDRVVAHFQRPLTQNYAPVERHVQQEFMELMGLITRLINGGPHMLEQLRSSVMINAPDQALAAMQASAEQLEVLTQTVGTLQHYMTEVQLATQMLYDVAEEEKPEQSQS